MRVNQSTLREERGGETGMLPYPPELDTMDGRVYVRRSDRAC